MKALINKIITDLINKVLWGMDSEMRAEYSNPELWDC